MIKFKSALILCFFYSFISAQNGILDAENGIIVGNNVGTEAGTVRWTGADFEGYDGSQWISLTASGALGSLLEDADGDTGIDVEGDSDDDIIVIRSKGDTIAYLTDRVVFIGKNSGLNSSWLSRNIGIGNSSLEEMNSGFENLAIGEDAFQLAKQGNFNIAIGADAMGNADSVKSNVAIGSHSLEDALHAESNVSIGNFSLNGLEDGNLNVAVGRTAGSTVSSGSKNTMIGGSSGRGFSSNSSNNVTVGYEAGFQLSSHQIYNSVMIGNQAGFQSKGDSTVFIGNHAGEDETASNVLYIENTPADSENALIYGEFDNDFLRLNADVLIKEGLTLGNSLLEDAGTIRWTGTDFEGYDGTEWVSLTLPSILKDSDGDTKIEVERTADSDKIEFTIKNDIIAILDEQSFDLSGIGQSLFIGESVGKNDDGSINRNTAMGYQAFFTNSTGDQNSAFGTFSLNKNIASNNSAFGFGSLQENTSGTRNSALGGFALGDNSKGNDNTSLGFGASGALTDGSDNVAIGSSAGSDDNSFSSYNVYVGSDAGAHNGISLHQKDRNVMIGFEAGYDVTTSGNIMIGYEAGKGETSGDRLYIANDDSDKDNALIYGEFNNDYLRVNGKLDLIENSGASSPQLRLKELGADGARMIMENDQNDNYWTVFGRPYTSSESSQINFHYADITGGGSETGNKFRIYGDGDAYLYHDNNGSLGGGLRLLNGNSPTEYWRMYTASTSGDLRFYSDNNTTSARAWINDATGAYSSASDERLKKNITALPSLLGNVLLLSPKNYRYKEQEQNEQQSIGLLAQETKELFPELVDYQEGADQYGINYAGFSVVAIKAIQEQQEIIEELEYKVDKQQAQITILLEQNKLILDSLKE